MAPSAGSELTDEEVDDVLLGRFVYANGRSGACPVCGRTIWEHPIPFRMLDGSRKALFDFLRRGCDGRLIKP